MTRIAGAYNSHNSFAFDDLTGFTPAFDGRSDFHLQIQPSNYFLGGHFYVLKEYILNIHPPFWNAVHAAMRVRDGLRILPIYTFSLLFQTKFLKILKKIKKIFFDAADKNRSGDCLKINFSKRKKKT